MEGSRNPFERKFDIIVKIVDICYAENEPHKDNIMRFSADPEQPTWLSGGGGNQEIKSQTVSHIKVSDTSNIVF